MPPKLVTLICWLGLSYTAIFAGDQPHQSLHDVYAKIEAHQRLTRMCGPLSATRLLVLTGHHVDPRQVLADYLASNHQGVRVRDVVRLCEKLGLRCRAIRSRQDSVECLPIPCILLVHDDQHCIVLESVDTGAGTALVWDPSVLKSKLVGLKGLNQIWSQKAIVFGFAPVLWQMADCLNLACAIVSLGILLVRVRSFRRPNVGDSFARRQQSPGDQ